MLRRLVSGALLATAAACGAGPPPRAPYRWQLDPRSQPVECRLDLPKGCASDRAAACEAALPELRAACDDASPCACARLGNTMMYARPAMHVDGLKLVDAACVRGVVDACDSALLVASLCGDRPLSTPACSFLRSLGRVPPPESQSGVAAGGGWRRGALPAMSTGCWVVATAVRDDADPASGAWAAPAEPLTGLCLDGDRVSVRTRHGWDQIKVAWEGLSDGTRWRGAGWDGAEIVPAQATVFTGGFRLGVTRADAAESARMRAQIARLGDYDAQCTRAARCEAAVSPMDWGPPRSLGECLSRLDGMRATFRQQAPGDPLPDECR